MSSLHELVYQMASNPHILRDMAQNIPSFATKFNLSPVEVRVLSTFSNNGQAALQPLLSAKDLKHRVSNILEGVWVPPEFP